MVACCKECFFLSLQGVGDGLWEQWSHEAGGTGRGQEGDRPC